MSAEHHLTPLVRKLRTRTDLDTDDITAILALPYKERVHEVPSYIVREGEPPRGHCSFIVSGFAYRHKLTAEGARQIVSLHMAGDFLDLQHLFLTRADHNVQALTRLNTIEIERAALQHLVLNRPAVAHALWIDTLIEASIVREWVVNVGRRDARSRIAHLLCEFAVRMGAAGLGEPSQYDLPLTQDQLADAVGLTPIHVNRTLKQLAAEGVVQRDRRKISFQDWERIRSIGEFSALYLHLDQTNGGAGPTG